MTELEILPAPPSVSHSATAAPSEVAPAAAWDPGEIKRIAASLGGFLFFLGVLWLAFYLIWVAFPYIRPGAVLIYEAKEKLERKGKLFPPSASRRLAIFGNSKVLAGFIPAQFDFEIPGYSFNLGKPDETQTIRDIELLARSGQLPHRILLTVPWTTNEAPATPFRFLQDDDAILGKLFPFRKFPRDLALFGILSRFHGGMRTFYRYSEESVSRMEKDRGWYFIEGQSHYANDRLPDGLRLASDRPSWIDDSGFDPRGREFERLNDAAVRYGLHYFLVPRYYREGELASPPEFAAAVAVRLQNFPHFTVAGPYYLLFPNHYFSDPVHLNREGARVYTHRLAEILGPFLRGG